MEELSKYIAPSILPPVKENLDASEKAKKVFVNIGENIAVVAHRIKYYFVHRYQTGKWEWLTNRSLAGKVQAEMLRFQVQGGTVDSRMRRIAEKLFDAGALNEEQRSKLDGEIRSVTNAATPATRELGDRFKQLGEDALNEGEYLVIRKGLDYEVFFKKDGITQSKISTFSGLHDTIDYHKLNFINNIANTEAEKRIKNFNVKSNEILKDSNKVISVGYGRYLDSAKEEEFEGLQVGQGFLVQKNGGYDLYFRDTANKVNLIAFSIGQNSKRETELYVGSHYVFGGEGPRVATNGKSFPGVYPLIKHFDVELLDRFQAIRNVSALKSS